MADRTIKRYVRLLAVVLVAGLLVGALAHLPRPASRTASGDFMPAPMVELAIEVSERGVEPEVAAVPKGHRVRLSVRNTTSRPLTVALAGYGRAVAIESLQPDSTRRLEFVADLPGDDFAWLVDGRPAGRLSVSGSHLVEGHR